MLVMLTACSSLNNIENTSIPDSAYPSEDIKIDSHTAEWQKTEYQARIKSFKNKPLVSGDIVMLGDSHTFANMISGAWDDKLDNFRVRNRGISGDTSGGVLVRLEEVIISKPKAVFLLIGTNDAFASIKPETTFANINEIVKKISTGSPQTKIFVQTLFPIRKHSHANNSVSELNHLLMGANSDKYTLVHLDKLFFDKQQATLVEDYYADNAHLSVKGYEKWVTHLNIYMRLNKL